VRVGAGFHLTYCSNIHAGETWPEVSTALAAALPCVRERLGVSGPLGVGLRLSARAADTLASPAALTAFKQFLAAGNYYVFTINGFPYGAFHGARVKENVYRPDWREDARLEYSNRLAWLLAELLPADVDGSVSTVPGAFRAEVTGDEHVRAMTSRLLRHAAFLHRLRERTGKVVTLALEPEPACFLETIDDAVRFFERHLFDSGAIAAASADAGVALSLDIVGRHLGVCLDTCHMAVEFEDPALAVGRLDAAGIRVFKVQVTSAIHVAPGDAATSRAALARFADDTYLHQVVRRSGHDLVRFTDLREALDTPADAAAEWRVHFHVPIFVERLQQLQTTQGYVAEVLSLLKRERVCRYLEVETYTWDVLPPEHRAGDACTAIARELAWVRQQIES
jgi:hypothetical protein